jgi:replicative DNA helicase|tara:strand:+ start:1651 stop:2985 length:1335 start_codon:yes stop_codon:yes gene_type:complete
LTNLKAAPSSKNAEESVLGCILLDGVSVYEKVAAWIRDEDAFYYKDNQVVWKAIKEIYKSGEPIDVITVTNKVKDTSPDETMGYFITGLPMEVATTANAEYHAKIIWERHIQREAAKTANKLYKTSFTDYEKLDTTLQQHSRLIDELKDLQPSKKTDIDVIISNTLSNLKNGSNIIPFGLQQLDYPAGGMTRKEVTVLGGRPGHGKTTLAINIVRSLIAQGYKVMLFNREMSNEEVMKKIIIMESKDIEYSKIRKNKLTDEEITEVELLSENIDKKYENLIMYDNIRKLSEAMLEISRYKPDIVLDDYIQLIQVDNIEERRFQIESIMYEYKWICKKENCSAILVSQLNREIEKRIDPKPRLSDFAESGVIEQTAETAIMPFYGWNFDNESHDKYEIEIIVPKSRYGTIGTYVMGFNGNRCKFYFDRDDAKNDIDSNTKRKVPF